MRWRFRPSTEPPRFAQLLVSIVTPPDERQVLLSDLQDEFEETADTSGTEAAKRAYWEQVRGSMVPGLAWRLSRLGRRRRALSWLARVPAWWRPAPEVPTDQHNRGENMFDYLNDVRLACRGLAKNPLIFAVVVLSLAVGIGASTTVFSMANAFLFRSPATDLPDDYVAIFTSDNDSRHGDTSYPDYLDLLDNVAAIESTLLHRIGGVELDDGGERQRLLVEIVGGHYFELMRLPLTLGRGFSAEENEIGSADRLVVLSFRLWQQRFGADENILGKTVRLDGHPYTVIGVGPQGYLSRFLNLRIDAWVPMGVAGGIYHVRPSGLEDRSDRQYRVLAQLQPGEDLATVRAQLEVLSKRLHEEYPEAWTDARGEARGLSVLSEQEALLPREMRAGLGGIFGVLLVGTGLIVLIACSNVACLFLARINLRRREMAMRLALGAGRRRIVLMLLVESLVPALVAGVLGSGLAYWACGALGSMDLPSGIPIPLHFDFQPDVRVLGFALLLSVLTSLAIGLAPALEGASPDLVTSLKADKGTGDRRPGRRLRLRRLLVVVQVAAALIFVVGTGFMLRSVQAASAVDLGIDIERNAVMARDLPQSRFNDEAAARYLQDVVERLRRRPEVEAAELALSAELSIMASIYEAVVAVDGYVPAEGESLAISHNAVTPGYMDMMGIRLLRGRGIEDRDLPGAPLAAVVSQAFAERFWPGADALGRSFQTTPGDRPAVSADDRVYQVVGIADDGHYVTLDEESPFFWTALSQSWGQRVMIHVRGRASDVEALRALNEETSLEQGESMWLLPTTYSQMISIHSMGPRLMSRFMGWGGLFALGLAAMGIYGIVSFTVTQRTREMAIRQALGARPGEVLRDVVGDGLRLALWGLVVGFAVALPLAALARNDVYGMSLLDPVALGGSILVLLNSAFFASAIPARRLSAVDPMDALRDE